MENDLISCIPDVYLNIPCCPVCSGPLTLSANLHTLQCLNIQCIERLKTSVMYALNVLGCSEKAENLENKLVITEDDFYINVILSLLSLDIPCNYPLLYYVVMLGEMPDACLSNRILTKFKTFKDFYAELDTYSFEDACAWVQSEILKLSDGIYSDIYVFVKKMLAYREALLHLATFLNSDKINVRTVFTDLDLSFDLKVAETIYLKVNQLSDFTDIYVVEDLKNNTYDFKADVLSEQAFKKLRGY